MSDQSRTSDQKNAGEHSTPSPESGAGPTPFALPGGQTMFQFGPDLAHVSPSLSPGEAKVQTMRATSGPLGFGSSESASLQSVLASKLAELTESTGSPLYKLTWKALGTPLGVPICQLRALGLRTSVNGFTGWPTSLAPNGGRSMSINKMSSTGMTVDGKKHTVSLEHAVKFLQGWGTPMSRDHKDKAQCDVPIGSILPRQVWRAGWPTMTASDAEKRHDGPAVMERMRSGKMKTCDQRLRNFVQLVDSGTMSSIFPSATEQHDRLNPNMSLWLQGYPVQWVLCAPIPKKKE